MSGGSLLGGGGGGLTGTTIKTIGTDGDYLDVAAFIADNTTPYHGVFVSDVTEDSAIAVDGILVLDLDRYTLTMGANEFTFASTANVTIKGNGMLSGAEIDWTPTGSAFLFNNAFADAYLDMSGFLLDNNSSGSDSVIARGIDQIRDLKVEMPNQAGCGFKPNVEGSFYDRIWFVGGGSTTQQAINAVGFKSAIVSNIYVTGTWNTTSSMIGGDDVMTLTNLISDASSDIQLKLTGPTSNLFADTNDINIDFGTSNNVTLSNCFLGTGSKVDTGSLDGQIVSNVIMGTLTTSSSHGNGLWNNCLITGAATINGDRDKFTNCEFIGGATVVSAADDNSFVNCQFGVDGGGGALTLTINSGANRTRVGFCMVDADISDSGTASELGFNSTY